MRRLSIVLIIVLGLMLPVDTTTAQAETSYVKDSFTITLRTGPSNKNKILDLIPSGQPVEVLESSGEWNLVRLIDDEAGREGWVLSRYLMTRIPWETQAMRIRNENTRLKKKIPHAQNELHEALQREKDLSRKLTTTTGELNDLEEKYESLRKGASGYLKLKEKYEGNRSELENAQKKVQALTDENKLLRASRSTKWFLAGALVLLFGLIIGLLIGQREKKRRSSISL